MVSLPIFFAFSAPLFTILPFDAYALQAAYYCMSPASSN